MQSKDFMQNRTNGQQNQQWQNDLQKYQGQNGHLFSSCSFRLRLRSLHPVNPPGSIGNEQNPVRICGRHRRRAGCFPVSFHTAKNKKTTI
jgi:hypothetical protein